MNAAEVLTEETQPSKPAMTLSEALQTWVDISGVDPCTRRFSFGDLSIQGLHRSLKEALELDPTEVTGLLLFDYVATIYMQDRTFNVDELLENPERVSTYLGKCRELRQFLRSERLQQIGAQFTERILQAVLSYGAATDDTLEMLKDRHTVAVLRRDALRTVRSLSVHQFLNGVPEAESVRPSYGKFVYQWANVNSMLKAMTGMPSGVTINLIRHPSSPHQSYFAFVIRNGGRLFMFTDRESQSHPLQADMIRRPDRVLAARSERNWFPYQLLGFEFTEDGDLYFPPIEGRNLVPYQKAPLPIAAIAELEPQQVIWLTMMLDLIVEKFWRQDYQAPSLSYTAEMIKIATPLLDAAKEKGLPVPVYHELKLPSLKVGDVRSDSIGRRAVGRFGPGQNRWLEERYADQVGDDVLNLVGADDVKLIKNSTKAGTLGDLTVIANGDEEGMLHSELEAMRSARVELDVFDASQFGSAKQLDADRRFLARGNFAKIIGHLAKIEFDRRKEEVISWVRKRVEANRCNLEHLFLEEEVLVPAMSSDTFDSTAGGARNKGLGTRQFMERVPIEGEKGKIHRDYLYRYYRPGSLWFNSGSKGSKYLCFETKATAQWVVKFFPESTADLAMLCGCEVSDLPDVLQHWTLFRKYFGNAIIERIDPIEWKLKDPWVSLPFTMLFFISASGMKAIEKRIRAREETAKK